MRDRPLVIQFYCPGLDPVDATIIRLAADAIWLSEIFDIPTITEEMNEKVLKYLFKISYIKKRGDT